MVIRALEEAAGLEGERVEGMTGVWVAGHKVAAIGVRAKRRVCRLSSAVAGVARGWLDAPSGWKRGASLPITRSWAALARLASAPARNARLTPCALSAGFGHPWEQSRQQPWDASFQKLACCLA